jgi:cyclase
MLKRRLIPVLYIKNGLIVRSEKFSYHQNLGNILSEAKRYTEWDVDELIYIDITRAGSHDLRRDDLRVQQTQNSSTVDLLKQISEVCFMPLTFGGHVYSMEDVKLRISNGADKISINTAAYLDPNLITQIAEYYGKQCVVISTDYKIIDNKPIVFIENGTRSTGLHLFDWVKKVENLGAGEHFINSIDRDGMACGYDIEILKKITDYTGIPVIAAGGAGSFDDFVEVAVETNISAIAAGNIFHFTEQSYQRAKKILKKNNVLVR